MLVNFVISAGNSFELEVPVLYPDMQIVRGVDEGSTEGWLYQVVSVRLQTGRGRHRSAREEVQRITAYVQPRGTAGVI